MGEVMRVGAGETGKASASAMNARERAKAGMDNYSSPQNLGGEYRVFFTLFPNYTDRCKS